MLQFQVLLIILSYHLRASHTENLKTIILNDAVIKRGEKVSLRYLPAAKETPLQQTGPILFEPTPTTTVYNGPPILSLMPPVHEPTLSQIADANPLLAAFLLGQQLGISPKAPGFNHPQHLPTNPYLALLLSHYGRYIPVFGLGRGIYGYTAANNYHNNLPIGSYKIYEDRDI